MFNGHGHYFISSVSYRISAGDRHRNFALLSDVQITPGWSFLLSYTDAWNILAKYRDGLKGRLQVP